MFEKDLLLKEIVFEKDLVFILCYMLIQGNIQKKTIGKPRRNQAEPARHQPGTTFAFALHVVFLHKDS